MGRRQASLWGVLVVALSGAAALASPMSTPGMRCLGEPPFRRRVVVQERATPLTIEIHPWVTSELLTHMAAFVLSDVMGFNVTVVPPEGSELNTIPRLAGCSEAQGFDRCCDPTTGHHVVAGDAPCSPEDAPARQIPSALANVELWDCACRRAVQRSPVPNPGGLDSGDRPANAPAASRVRA